MVVKSIRIFVISAVSVLCFGCSTPPPGDVQMYPASPLGSSSAMFAPQHSTHPADPVMHAGY